MIGSGRISTTSVLASSVGGNIKEVGMHRQRDFLLFVLLATTTAGDVPADVEKGGAALLALSP